MEMIGRTGVHELSSILKADCHFSSEYYGRWVSFDGSNLYYFVIEHGQITSNSSMGTLICKGRHWVSSSYFKVASIRNDGCWLRYCCLHLSIKDEVIQSRLSGCSRIDKSFDSCRISHSDMNDNSIFRVNDAQKPGNDNALINNLLSASSVQMQSCDFGDVLETEVLFSDGTQCSGTLRDVDVINSSCILRPSVEFQLTACQHKIPKFYCVASIRLSSGNRLLVTNTTKRSVLQCWVVKHRLDDGLRPTHHGIKKLSFIMKRCHCNSGEIIKNAIVGSNFSTTNVELSAVEAFHADSETCKERLEVGVLIKKSDSSTQSRTPALFHYNLTNESLVQGHSLHDLNSHHLSSRKRKQHVETSDDAKDVDDDSVASFSNPNDSAVNLLTMSFLFGHFAFTLFSNDIKCYAVNFVL